MNTTLLAVVLMVTIVTMNTPTMVVFLHCTLLALLVTWIQLLLKTRTSMFLFPFLSLFPEALMTTHLTLADQTTIATSLVDQTTAIKSLVDPLLVVDMVTLQILVKSLLAL